MTIETVELVVTRGLPASGKSTWAKDWVAQNVRHRARIERDALRAMMHDSVWKGHHTENQVVAVQIAAVSELLQSGISVVVSDTNLDVHVFNTWKNLAEQLGAFFRMQDFRDVPLDVCLERNAKRTGRENIPVPAIRSMYERYIQ